MNTDQFEQQFEIVDAGDPVEQSKAELLNLLIRCREACLFVDDDGTVCVTEDAVIPSDLFDQICAAINKNRGS